MEIFGGKLDANQVSGGKGGDWFEEGKKKRRRRKKRSTPQVKAAELREGLTALVAPGKPEVWRTSEYG